MIDFTDRVCVVTGGAMGIGKKIVEILHGLNARVVIADIDEAAAQRASEEIGGIDDSRVTWIKYELGPESEAKKLAEFCRENFGRVDVLVNNAAMRMKGLVTEATEEDWARILGVNVGGVGLACKHLIPLMTSGDSAIVNISSANAIGGRTKMALYDASKAAVMALSRDLACDHAEQGIRVNTILPGPTLTDFHQGLAAKQGQTLDVEAETSPHSGGPGILKRRGKPEEIASAIVFLASSAASYITGTSLNVDGGLLAVADGRPAGAR